MRAEEERRRLLTELARRKNLDPYRALGLAPGATAEAVRAAFLDATKQFHPTRFARLDAETREAATELFLVIRKAWVELDEEQKRARWTAKPAPTKPISTPLPPSSTAESKAVTKERPAPPVRTTTPAPPPKPLIRASKLQAGSAAPSGPRPEVAAMLASAKTRTARFEEGMKLLVQGEYRRAREAFHRLATEDPHSKKVRAHMHWAWGLEHKAEGRVADAQRELERGLGIDPEHHEIAEELRKLDTGKGKDMGKGLFSKLLGR
jgi:hypothetical protein